MSASTSATLLQGLTLALRRTGPSNPHNSLYWGPALQVPSSCLPSSLPSVWSAIITNSSAALGSPRTLSRPLCIIHHRDHALINTWSSLALSYAFGKSPQLDTPDLPRAGILAGCHPCGPRASWLVSAWAMLTVGCLERSTVWTPAPTQLLAAGKIPPQYTDGPHFNFRTSDEPFMFPAVSLHFPVHSSLFLEDPFSPTLLQPPQFPHHLLS